MIWRGSTVYTVLGILTLLSAGSAFATGLLTDPSSSYSFLGQLWGEEVGQELPYSSFNIPLDFSDTNPNDSQSDTTSTVSEYVSSGYFLDIISDFQSGNDYLNLQLNLGVSGAVSGFWSRDVVSASSLDGSRRSFFTLEEWSSTEMTVVMLWTLIQNGSGFIYPPVNSIRICGPVDADPSIQTGFLYERVFEIPSNWEQVSTVFSQTTENMVAGIYMVDFFSDLSSETALAGVNGNASFGIDMNNSVTIEVQNTIDPNGCLIGVPCPTLADIDGNDLVDSADFHLWYLDNVDVTGDGIPDTADEAAMAYLLGLEMIDADGNGYVDGLAASPVTPGAAISAAVQLHPAYPNPFNPMTVLSFTLPSAEAVDLAVYDVKGNRIRSLLSGAAHSAGLHEVTWNGRNDAGLPTPAGVYFFRLETKGDVQTGRMLLLK